MDTNKYCTRFGKLAVDMAFITEKQLYAAMEIQIREDLQDKPHRLIGQILFDQDLMTPSQIDEVLQRLFQQKER